MSAQSPPVSDGNAPPVQTPIRPLQRRSSDLSTKGTVSTEVEATFNRRIDDCQRQIDSISRDISWVWNMPFDRLTMKGAVQRIEQFILRRTPSFVITANLNYAMLNHRDESVQQITQDADLILADGQPIVWRSQTTSAPLPERVAGSELIHELAHRADELGWGIYFLGGDTGVAQSCADSLSKRYPGMRVAGVESPPFRDLSEAEQAAQSERIRSSGADILMVALGQPKGERWIHQHYQSLGTPVCIQLGASFDFIAGKANRAPVVFRKFGLEWAHRMMTDPKRLVPRYLGNAGFLATALVRDWRKKCQQWGMLSD